MHLKLYQGEGRLIHENVLLRSLMGSVGVSVGASCLGIILLALRDLWLRWRQRQARHL